MGALGGRAPPDRFAARQALDARLADARIERVLSSRRRLGNAIDTAMDAVLIARRAGAPAAQMDRCYERHKRARCRLDRYERAVEPVVRDHDAAARREELPRNGNASANARVAEAEARARRGCPRATAARPDRRADAASRAAPSPARTAPRPAPS